MTFTIVMQFAVVLAANWMGERARTSELPGMPPD